MRKPLKGGTVSAQPKTVRARPPKSVRNRRIAGLCVGVASVVTAGILSTMFVGYLADRALERAANAPRSVALAESADAAENPNSNAATATQVVAPPPIIQGIPVKTQAAPSAKAAYSIASTEPAAAAPTDAQSSDALAFAASKPAAKQPPDIVKSANPADGTYTGAIPTARPEPDTPAAKPVQTSAAAKPEPMAVPEPPVADGATTAATETAGQNARVNRSVTMRSGPEKGAGAIGTIPGKAAITLMSCKAWCEVVYNGKRGFIYKGFVDRS